MHGAAPAPEQSRAHVEPRREVPDLQHGFSLPQFLRGARRGRGAVGDGKLRWPVRASHSAEPGHGVDQHARIGMPRAREHVRRCPRLDLGAAIHHKCAIGDFGDDAHVVRDEEHGHVLLHLHALDEVEDLALDGDVERRCRLVGDQQFRLRRERHRDHHALPHAAGEAMRRIAEAAPGVGHADPIEQPQRLRACRRLARTAMTIDRFRNLLADNKDRVEARHRLLEDHRDAGAANLPHRFGVERRQFATHELHAAFDAARPVGQQAHHGQRGDALARPRFADDRERFARMDVEAQVHDHGAPRVADAERRRETAYGQHRGHAPGLRLRPRAWSRRGSPNS